MECFLFAVVRFFQDYTEPEETQSSSQAPPRGDANPLHPAAVATEDEKVVLPLGENVLTHNLGIPIVVVLTKVRILCICVLVSVSTCAVWSGSMSVWKVSLLHISGVYFKIWLLFFKLCLWFYRFFPPPFESAQFVSFGGSFVDKATLVLVGAGWKVNFEMCLLLTAFQFVVFTVNFVVFRITNLGFHLWFKNNNCASYNTLVN